ncbi:MAG: NAD(P)/FAD-dependent oxidoreductase [Candidatus Omnitrophica bacterium]|nr:NAD(P)/FAD-dependent oxidoreductase [Candidatus Omnitrophota bacterium]
MNSKIAKNKYDAVIVGGGVSGLVCGCYLARAGLQTILFEKNANAGGYSGSFLKKGFVFDACAHALGSLRAGGFIDQVLKDLEIKDRLKMKRYDPSDIVISKDFKLHFWSDIDKTIREFSAVFPKEAENISRFFKDVIGLKNISLAQLKSKSFKDFLDSYFKEEKLIAAFSLPVLGNTSLSASKISAYTAVALYKEFILDGGYYPGTKMQDFVDILVKRFKEFGGEILPSTLVEKISIKEGKVEGVYINKDEFIQSRYVISNIDARQTFLDLVKGEIDIKFSDLLKDLVPSLSIFILYLGTDGQINSIPSGVNVWFLPNYDVENMYKIADKKTVDQSEWFMVRLAPNKKSITMLVTSSFESPEYWAENKNRLIDVFIKKIEQVIPDLSKHVLFKDAATPNTLYKWTLNYRGAAYGWAGVPSQFAVPGLSQSTPIKNLYLTGHWTTLVQGIPGVVYLGRDTATIILNREKIKK